MLQMQKEARPGKNQPAAPVPSESQKDSDVTKATPKPSLTGKQALDIKIKANKLDLQEVGAFPRAS